MTHDCKDLIVTCIDYRLQRYILSHLRLNHRHGTYDRVSLAGGVHDLKYVLGQVDISKQLHHINRVVLVNHEDCGAYGEEGTLEQHTKDLHRARAQILKKHPDLKVEAYFLHLDGTFKRVL